MLHRRKAKQSRLVVIAAAITGLPALVQSAPPIFTLLPKTFNAPGAGIQNAARIDVGAMSADGSTVVGGKASCLGFLHLPLAIGLRDRVAQTPKPVQPSIWMEYRGLRS